MKKNELDDFYIKRELKIKKIITIICIAIILIAIVTFFSLYIAKAEFRQWVDYNILRKEIETSDVATIDLNSDKNNQVYCYSNYICTLKEKKLTLYNASGEKDTQIDIDINTAIFNSSDKYLAIAEKNGKQLCVIFDKNFLWEQEIDGEILKIVVNRNGYVAVVSTDTTYKSIITLYNAEGKRILKYYLSSTRIIDIDISKDNNYIAFAELDSSGALISSNVKILSVEKADKNPEEAIYYTYNAPISKLITKIKYQAKGELVCMYDDSIDIIKNQNASNLISVDKNITYMSANLNNRIAYIKEENVGLFNYDSVLNIIDTSNNSEVTYKFEEVAKEMYAYDNIIGINVGTEIYFVNTKGALIKKYKSNQEITDVILSNDIAIIIYKDKVEIINL